MDDGSQQDFSKNDVMLLPPGHDAWSVGNEPCVFVEFSRGNDYYTGDHGHREFAALSRLLKKKKGLSWAACPLLIKRLAELTGQRGRNLVFAAIRGRLRFHGLMEIWPI